MAKHDDHPGNASPKPHLTPRAQQMEAERREREAAALRENLARRKAQQRARRIRPPAPGKGQDRGED